MRRSPADTRPQYRQLRIYAIDPMVARAGDHQATVQIGFEVVSLRGESERGVKPETLAVSFAGRRLESSTWTRPASMDFVRSDLPPSANQGIFAPATHGKWIDGSIPC